MMTGNFTSIARPYAMAAFEYALAKNALPAWEELLQTAAVVAEDPLIALFMTSPEVSNAQLANLFCDVLNSELDTEKKNFLCLLAEHKRFAVLPAIAEQFKAHRAAHEKKVTVEVSSAVTLDAEQQQRLVQALTKRLHLQVTLSCTLDPSLLGGVIVRIGDKVIDGSVRGKLHRLIEFI
jgi:F-type H+-transporting ATPase subunit delta